jgi:hypothetical protein
MMRLLEKETDTFDDTYEAPAEQSKSKCQTSTPVVIAPRPMIQNRRSNPFKKVANVSANTSASALTHLTKKSIGYNDSISSINPDDENKASNNISKTQNRSVSLDTPRPGNFGQWFIANKEDLRSANPNASDGELMKIGKSMYKDLTQRAKSPIEESPSSDPLMPINKRKLDMNEDAGNESSGGTKKQAKLVTR